MEFQDEVIVKEEVRNITDAIEELGESIDDSNLLLRDTIQQTGIILSTAINNLGDDIAKLREAIEDNY